jgi:hypothetical protein
MGIRADAVIFFQKDKRMNKTIGGRDAHYSGGTTTDAPSSAPAPKPAAAAPLPLLQPRQDLFDAGIKMASLAFSSRDWGVLASLARDANSRDPLKRQSGYSALLGCSFFFASVLDQAVQLRAVTVTGGRITWPQLYYSFSTDLSRFNGELKSLLQAAVDLRKAVPGLTATPAGRAEDNKPQKIEITAMPRRETATLVKRDQAGDIASSVQLEQDAA